MSDSKWGCLKTTAIGCGIALVAAIAIPVIFAVMVMAPLNRAVEDRGRLEAAFGAQDEYVPPPSGAPTAERIERFLDIQRSLAEVCGDLEHAEQQVAELESIDHQDEIDRFEVMKMAFSTTRSMMGVGPVIGHLFEIRNRELLAAEMGLGEYTYIFVMAFHDQLLAPPREFQLFGPGPVNSRVRGTLRSMLGNQLAALRSSDGDEASIGALESELALMEEDSSRLPWQSGRPAAIVAAFEPFSEELDSLYCPALAPLATMINEKKGLVVESD